MAIGSPALGGLFTVFCEATVTGITAIVVITGPGGDSESLPNSSQGNGVFRGSLVFSGVSTSDAGVYTCSVMVGGSTVDSVTAIMDVNGESLEGMLTGC